MRPSWLLIFNKLSGVIVFDMPTQDKHPSHIRSAGQFNALVLSTCESPITHENPTTPEYITASTHKLATPSTYKLKNTSTQKLINSKTYHPINAQTYHSINLQTQKLFNSRAHQLINSKA